MDGQFFLAPCLCCAFFRMSRKLGIGFLVSQERAVVIANRTAYLRARSALTSYASPGTAAKKMIGVS